jgi:hypothetical protein
MRGGSNWCPAFRTWYCDADFKVSMFRMGRPDRLTLAHNSRMEVNPSRCLLPYLLIPKRSGPIDSDR